MGSSSHGLYSETRGSYGKFLVLGFLFVSVLIVRALLFAADFWKLPYGSLLWVGTLEVQTGSSGLRRTSGARCATCYLKTPM